MDQQGKAAGTFYVPGDRLRTALGIPATAESLRPDTTALRPEFPALRPELAALRSELPPDVTMALDQLGSRAAPGDLDAVLIRLAQWRPLSVEELGGLTGRAPEHLRKRNVKRLLSEGRLSYLYPAEPNHPDQKYIAVPEPSKP